MLVNVRDISEKFKPNPRPQHPNPIITEANFKWAEDSCWADSAFTGLFKVPGSWFENVIRSVENISVVNGSGKNVCTPIDARNIHESILRDIDVIQTSKKRLECQTRKIWTKCVENPLPQRGERFNVVDLLESMFKLYNVYDKVLILSAIQNNNAFIGADQESFIGKSPESIEGNKFNIKKNEIPEILIISTNLISADTRTENFTSETPIVNEIEFAKKLDFDIKNDTDENVTFTLASVILFSGAHYNNIIRDPNNDIFWFFDAQQEEVAYELGDFQTANIISTGTKYFQPEIYIYFRKNRFQPNPPEIKKIVPDEFQYRDQLNKLAFEGYTDLRKNIDLLNLLQGNINSVKEKYFQQKTNIPVSSSDPVSSSEPESKPFEYDEQMSTLVSMEFNDIEKNKSLLVKHRGNVNEVVQELLGQVGGQNSIIANTLDSLQSAMEDGVKSGSDLLGDASKLAGQFWQNVTQGMDVAAADTVKEASKNLDLVCNKNEQIINMFNKLPMGTRRMLNKKMDLTMFNKVHKLCKEKGSVLSQLENVAKMSEFTKKRDEAIRLITKFQSGLKPEAAEKAAQGLLSFLPVIYEKERN